jgi:hypothetical protein
LTRARAVAILVARHHARTTTATGTTPGATTTTTGALDMTTTTTTTGTTTTTTARGTYRRRVVRGAADTLALAAIGRPHVPGRDDTTAAMVGARILAGRDALADADADALARAALRSGRDVDSVRDALALALATARHIAGTPRLARVPSPPPSGARRRHAPPTPVVRAPDAGHVAVPGTPYGHASFPTKLATWCDTRGARVVVPSHALPAHASCPSAVTASVPHADAPGAQWGEGEGDAPAVCGDGPRGCYAARYLAMRPGALAAHDARYADMRAATAAWARVVRVVGERVAAAAGGAWASAARVACVVGDVGEGDALALAVTGAAWHAIAPHVPPSRVGVVVGDVATWGAVAWRVVRAMWWGMVPQMACPCCVAGARLRWHMSGDVYSWAHADTLRHIWAALVDAVPSLRVWCPSRNWHDGAPRRLRDSTYALATWRPSVVRVVPSALHHDHDVPVDVVTAWYGGSVVVSGADTAALALASGVPTCHAQARAVTHTCEHCDTCYGTVDDMGAVVPVRVAYRAH